MARVPFVERRVEQAPLQVELSTARATGQQFGSQVAESAGVVAGQATQAVLQYQATKDNQASMDAFNAYTEKTGKLKLNFDSMQGRAVTDEAKQKYVEDLELARNEFGQTLRGRARQQYDAATAKSGVAKRLDAEAHAIRETRNAAEAARQAMVATGVSEAVAFDGDISANEALQRALTAEAMNPALQGDPDAIKARQQQIASQVAAQAFDRTLKTGDLDGADRKLEAAKASGMVTPEALQAMGDQMSSARQHQNDQVIARGIAERAQTEVPGVRPIDADVQREQALAVLRQQEADGEIRADQADRVRRVVEADFAQVKRARAVSDDAALTQSMAIVQEAGTLRATQNYIATLPPDQRWMAPGLVARAEQLYGDEAKRLERENLTRSLAPDQILQTETLLMQQVQAAELAGTPMSAESVAAQAAAQGLPKDSVDKLADFARNRGVVNGLTVTRVVNGITAPGVKKQFKEDPARAAALFQAVSETWDLKEDVNDATLIERVQQMLWEGQVADAGNMSFMDARIAGREAEWQPSLTAEQRTQVQAEVKAVYDRLFRMEGAAWAEFRETGNQEAADRASALQLQRMDLPRPYDPPSAFSSFAASAMAIPAAFVLGDPQSAFESAADPRATALSSYVRADKFGSLLPKAIEGEARVQTTDAFLTGKAEAEARADRARASLYDYVSAAKDTQGVGRGAVQRTLEKSIEGGKLPLWVNQYREAVGAEPVPAQPNGDPEWATNARIAAYEALWDATGR